MYKGLPGYQKILRREYTIADEDSGGALIDTKKWASFIRPGMQLSLNVIVKVPSSWNIQYCPRCKTHSIGPPLRGTRTIWLVYLRHVGRSRADKIEVTDVS